jgi:diadenylate cyclase
MIPFDNLIYIYDILKPILDIAVLAFIFYKVYEILVETQGLQIFRAVVTLCLIYLFALFLNLETILWLLSKLAPGVLVGFAIIFQPELRKVILHIGQRDWFAYDPENNLIDQVLVAAEILSKRKRGMLIVFKRNSSLKDIIKSGIILNANVSSSLVETIFAHDNPLHDGATVIQDGKIFAAACFLPISENYDIKKTFGSRHRAALGLVEKTDAVALVVSEETGAISLAYDSKLNFDLTLQQVSYLLNKLLYKNSKLSLQEESENDD